MKSIRQLFLALALVCMSSNSWAILIDVVGDLDTFLSSTDLINSGSASEETWVESVLGVDISYTQLDESISGGDTGNWEQVTNNGADILNHYAFFLETILLLLISLSKQAISLRTNDGSYLKMK